MSRPGGRVTQEDEEQRKEAEREEHPTTYDKVKMQVDLAAADAKTKVEV
jgi:hypothetical protein